MDKVNMFEEVQVNKKGDYAKRLDVNESLTQLTHNMVKKLAKDMYERLDIQNPFGN